MSASSFEIWGNSLYSMCRASGSCGEVGDWDQQVWVTESQLPVGQKEERNNSFLSMIACFRFYTEFYFQYTTEAREKGEEGP